MPQSRDVLPSSLTFSCSAQVLQSQEVPSALTLCTLRPTEKGSKCPKPGSLCVTEQKLCLANGAKAPGTEVLALLLCWECLLLSGPDPELMSTQQPSPGLGGTGKGPAALEPGGWQQCQLLLHLHNNARGTQLVFKQQKTLEGTKCKQEGCSK